MKIVTLVFQSETDLEGFTKAITTGAYHADFRNLTFSFRASDDDIKLAEKDYRAKVLPETNKE